jgi:hypothetical protein
MPRPFRSLLSYLSGGDIVEVSDANPLPTTAALVLDASDIQIGAVEIKDGVSDNRAAVDAAGKLSVKQADGDDGALGATSDPDATGNGTVISILKRLRTLSTPTAAAPTVGEFAPGVAAAQFPAGAGRYVRMKARAANAGNVYIGAAGVTKADGTTDTTTGLQLAAGDDTGWIPIDNLNRFYGIGDNAADSVTYMVLA